jgi:molybdenum cofactor cytidylyltransferase
VEFGPVPTAEAVGAILAHSMTAGARRIKKGRRLSAADADALMAAGVMEVVAARFGPGDMAEDAAAALIAEALAGDAAARGLDLSAPFTGRANLFAAAHGVLTVDVDALAAANAVDESITVATLPPYARVAPRQMAATVKIIPYAAPRAAVEAVAAALRRAEALRVHPVTRKRAALALTATPGMKPSLLDKGARAVRARLDALGVALIGETRVAHETGALAHALEEISAGRR